MAEDLNDARWRKSTRSANSGACVEVALLPTTSAIRDSKNPAGGALLLPTAAWHNLRATAKDA